MSALYERLNDACDACREHAHGLVRSVLRRAVCGFFRIEDHSNERGLRVCAGRHARVGDNEQAGVRGGLAGGCVYMCLCVCVHGGRGAGLLVGRGELEGQGVAGESVEEGRGRQGLGCVYEDDGGGSNSGGHGGGWVGRRVMCWSCY